MNESAMAWFNFASNDAFTPDFQSYMFDALEDCGGDPQGAFLPQMDKINPRPMHDHSSGIPSSITLLAACYYEPGSSSREIQRTLFSDPVCLNIVSNDWPHRMRSAGILAAWAAIRVNDPSLKSALLTKLYRHHYEDLEENLSVISGEDPLGELSCAGIRRAIRLASIGKSGITGDSPRASTVDPRCFSLDILLNPNTVDAQRLIGGLLDQIKNTSAQSTFKSPALAWLNELVRVACIQGQQPQDIIAGAMPILEAIAKHLCVADEDMASFQRWALINAMCPFPEAVAVLNPQASDLFPAYCGSLKEVVSHNTVLAKSGYGFGDQLAVIYAVFQAMETLGIEPGLSDFLRMDKPFEHIRHWVAHKDGVYKEFEHWVVNQGLVSHNSFHMRSAFAQLEPSALDDATVTAISLYRASKYEDVMLQGTGFSHVSPRAGDQERMVERLIERGLFNHHSVRYFQFDQSIVNRYRKHLAMGSRRQVFEDDLGL